jgi:cytochrome c-type biogenesis protein CcmH
VRPVQAIALAALLLCTAAASDPSERLPDPAQEARARELFAEIRCVVCQNESIDDSEAEIAADLRKLVRQQVAEGRTESQVKAFLVQRYGEFILLRPAFSAGNLLLWLTPFSILLVGLAALLARRRRPEPAGVALSPEEEARLLGIVNPPGQGGVQPAADVGAVPKRR